MKIFRLPCTPAELPGTERDWRNQGFRLVQKTDEKQLEPGEYMKSSASGSERNFNDVTTWYLCRRES